LQTYLYFDDSFLRENYYWHLPTGLEIGILWYTHRTPSTIYAMAKAIIQLCPHSPTAPLPDFQSLSPKQKEGIYQHVEKKLKPSSVNRTQLTIYAKFYLIDTWRDVASLALNLTYRKYTKILPRKAAHLHFCVTSQQTTRSRNCTTSTPIGQ
jgi:hypothetical protein